MYYRYGGEEHVWEDEVQEKRNMIKRTQEGDVRKTLKSKEREENQDDVSGDESGRGNERERKQEVR